MLRRFLVRSVLAGMALATLGCEAIDRSAGVGRRDYSIDPSARYQHVDLSILVANPRAADDVEFDALFRQHNEYVWAPLYTVFTPEAYASFSVWPVDARLWESTGLVFSYVPTLFINKTYNKDFKAYLGIRKYEKVHIKGKVRSYFQDRPWIEVISIAGTGQITYDDDSLALFLAGLNDLQQKNNALAIQHLEAALNGSLGRPAKMLAHLRLGWLYESRGAVNRKVDDWKAARTQYYEALAIDPSDATAKEGVGRAERAIDRNGVGFAPPELPTAEPSSRAGDQTEEWKAKYETERLERARADKAAADAEQKAAMIGQQLDETAKAKAKIETDLKTLQDEIASSGGAAKTLTEKVKALEAQVAGKDEALGKLEDEKKGLTAELATLKKMQAEQPAAGADAEALRKQIADKEAQIATKNTEIQELKDAKDMQNSLIASLRDDREKLEKEIEQLRKEIADLKKQIEEKK